MKINNPRSLSPDCGEENEKGVVEGRVQGRTSAFRLSSRLRERAETERSTQGTSRQTGSEPASLGRDFQASIWQEPGDAMLTGTMDLLGGNLGG